MLALSPAGTSKSSPPPSPLPPSIITNSISMAGLLLSMARLQPTPDFLASLLPSFRHLSVAPPSHHCLQSISFPGVLLSTHKQLFLPWTPFTPANCFLSTSQEQDLVSTWHAGAAHYPTPAGLGSFSSLTHGDIPMLLLSLLKQESFVFDVFGKEQKAFDELGLHFWRGTL